MQFINCTPHPITLISQDGSFSIFPKGEIVPRLVQNTVEVDTINGVSITETSFGETTNLPEKQEGVYLIVSRMILEANKDRNDLLVPNELVRDEAGVIIGCKSLSRN